MVIKSKQRFLHVRCAAHTTQNNKLTRKNITFSERNVPSQTHGRKVLIFSLWTLNNQRIIYPFFIIPGEEI